MSLPNYTVYRSTRKSIRLILHPDGTLAVYCPRRCSKKQIDDAVKKLYPSMKVKHNARGNALFGDNNTLPYLGTRYPVIYNNVEKFIFDGKRFISPSPYPNETRQMYREFLRNEAKRLIPSMAAQISKEFNFSYGKISIKSAYSRFGSCSAKKNLNFTLALAAFDTEFIYAVVCHELCHTVHLNHSAKFHWLLNAVCPQHDALHKNGAEERSLTLKSIFFNPVF